MNALTMSATRRRSQVVNPGAILRALFSPGASLLVLILTVAALWWHIVSIADAAAAQRAAALDVLRALPWAMVWAVRATLISLQQKGGDR